MTAAILPGLVAGVAIGAAAGYLGSLMLGRRLALVAGPLGHLTLPGVALALLLGWDVSLGAFPIVVVGAWLIWSLELRTKLPTETLTAVVFATGVALTFLLLPVAQAEAALVGDLLRTDLRMAAVTALLSVALMVAVHWRYRAFVLINISEDLAASTGLPVRRYNLSYLLLVAVVVALGVRVVGGLLIAALVAIPAATARNVARDLRRYAITATIAGALSAALGVAIAAITNVPAGPLIVLVSASFFVLSLPFASKV